MDAERFCLFIQRGVSGRDQRVANILKCAFALNTYADRLAEYFQFRKVLVQRCHLLLKRHTHVLATGKDWTVSFDTKSRICCGYGLRL